MNDATPSWGKTIGAFFLFGILAIGASVISSASILAQMRYTGYSTGGLAAIATAIACAAYYRSTGKMRGPLIASIVTGVAIGFLAVQISGSLAGLW